MAYQVDPTRLQEIEDSIDDEAGLLIKSSTLQKIIEDEVNKELANVSVVTKIIDNCSNEEITTNDEIKVPCIFGNGLDDLCENLGPNGKPDCTDCDA
jgi:hypothetical protein